MGMKDLRREIMALKNDMDVTEEPTTKNFYKWCEDNYYHREVNSGEMVFKQYSIGHGEMVTSDPDLFLRLSHKYFVEMHKVPNPFKENEQFGLKFWLCNRWWRVNRFNVPFNVKEAIHDPDYLAWYENAWRLFLAGERSSIFNEY